MYDAKALRKGVLWNTGGNMVYMACQFIFSMLVVRLAGETGSGLFNLAQSYANISLTIASYGMYSFQVSDARNKYSTSCYIKSRFATVSIATGVCACLIAFGGLFLGYGLMQCVCILLFHAYRMIESATDVFNAAAQRQMDLILVGKTYAFRGVVSLISFGVILTATHSVPLTLAVMFFSNLVVFLRYTLVKSARHYEKQPVALQQVKALLIECFPLAIYSALSTTTASLPKILMEQVLGTNALGVYSPVTTPVLLLQVGATYLFTPFITIFSNSYAERNRRSFWRAVGMVQAILLALLPVGLFISEFLGTWGLRVFVGAGMEAYQFLLSPMVVSAVLTATVLFYSMILTIMRCMRGLIAANLLGIAVCAALCVPCMKLWDMQGATYAGILALLVQAGALGTVILVRSRRHFSAGPHRPLQEPDGLPTDACDTQE